MEKLLDQHPQKTLRLKLKDMVKKNMVVNKQVQKLKDKQKIVHLQE